MKKVLVIDNYDSFTFNLVHYLEDLGAEVTILRNDEFDIDEIDSFDKILLSPGPGIPDEAGLLKEVIKTYAATKSILGICLGLQAISEVFNSKLINLESTLHGISSQVTITDNEEPVFRSVSSPFEAGHYHSWVVDPATISDELIVTSIDSEGRIMSLRHKTLDVRGVQFHPESILTPQGKTILKNWLDS
ncbi:MAG: anthranilate synthase component II [Flavobacterium sp.]